MITVRVTDTEFIVSIPREEGGDVRMRELLRPLREAGVPVQWRTVREEVFMLPPLADVERQAQVIEDSKRLEEIEEARRREARNEDDIASRQ